MKNRPNKNFLKKAQSGVVLFFVALVWTLAASFSLLDKFDYRLYDLMLAAKKEAAKSDDILFVEIDNAAVESIGQWPWSRDVIADGLLRMKELGAKLALFDIEYIHESNRGEDPDAKKKLSEFYHESRRKNIGFSEFWQNIESNVYRDNDAYFANALQFFGNSWLTINTFDIGLQLDEEDKDYVTSRCLYRNVVDEKDSILKGNLANSKEQGSVLGFTPARRKFIEKANGAGFTNVVIDNDGTRRRIELLLKHGDGYIAQLAFSPILSILKPYEIVRTPFSLILKGAIDESGNTRDNKTFLDEKNVRRKDIKIPLDRNGRMFLNWLHSSFEKSFRHESFLFLNELGNIENNVVALLEELWSLNLPGKDGSELSYSKEVRKLLKQYEDILEFKASLLEMCKGYNEEGFANGGGIFDDYYTEYFSMRADFFENVKKFCAGPSLAEVTDNLEKMQRELGEKQAENLAIYFTERYDTIAYENDMYLSYFSDMQETYSGSFCILGETASSTSDLGTNPFARMYPNVGTHANVYNTIINEDFIRPISWVFAVLFSILAAIFYLRTTSGKSALKQNSFGILMVLFVVAVPVLMMIIFGIYVPIVASSLIAITFYISITIVRFVSSEKDKGTLRRAFSTYVAPAVVEQIIKDPTLLKLGGDERHITALFTDIKAFSSFSELVTPTRLVSILNEYLGAMSDEILKVDGTIDKYIGDAIVSFFGAPLPMEDHAWRACIAAINMKKIEAKFNEERMKDGTIPSELHTRIGINTGDMVAGNMGTVAKMNYTIMGNDVNLASRLEGVNKTYHSWILCSEQTFLEADRGEHKGLLLARKFDRVRVVGIDKPVQLYNILGLKEEMPAELIESVDIFHDALELYLKKDFKKAGKLFMDASKKYPADESALVFASRCKEYIEKGVPENWDGVVNMLTK